MKLDRYQLKAESTLMVFEFVSEGPQGQIKKLIQYSETNLKDFYNLGFGDKDERTGEIDDTIITNNGDSQKALATVAATVYAFTEKYPDSWIYATGSNIIRTRLYRMGITNNLIEIQKDFVVYGLKGNQWEVFEKEITYDAFLVKRKKK
ncbi:DUF6934 family protein [Adhaeribacter aerolatus]|nr:hypothetical protein [Adhaeribacter aerolatus]